MKESKTHDWLKLDNAAKFFPFTSNKRDTKVFRFACELNENIKKEQLQIALNQNLEDFPLYKTVLKRGLFWYYLEESELKPIVLEENEALCSPIYTKNKRNLLFKLTYYKRRINLEVYHALSDGAGALEFLRALVTKYLTLTHKELGDKKIDLKFNASMHEKITDSFKKYYNNNGHKSSDKIKRAYKIRGIKHRERRIETIEGFLSTKEVIALAKSKNTTVTIFLAALFLKSIQDEMRIRDKKKDVVLTIPVNFRQFFKSLSMRNFFGVFNIGYNFQNMSDEIDEIIIYLNKYFNDNLNFDQISGIINKFMALESNILLRAIPLFIKDILLWIYALVFDSNTTTASLSNVGKVEMPEEISKYIKDFSVFVSTNKVQITLISYKDNMNISFTSPFRNTSIQRNFFKYLTDMGLNVKISSNMLGDEDE